MHHLEINVKIDFSFELLRKKYRKDSLFNIFLKFQTQENYCTNQG